jgi:hypothetical protein
VLRAFIGIGFSESDHHGGTLEVLRSFCYYVAFVLFLVYLINEQEALAAPHWGSESDESTAGVHSERFGSFVKRLTFSCSAINQYGQVHPLTLAVATLGGARDYRYVLALSGYIRGRFRFVQEMPKLTHIFPRTSLVRL